MIVEFIDPSGGASQFLRILNAIKVRGIYYLLLPGELLPFGIDPDDEGMGQW